MNNEVNIGNIIVNDEVEISPVEIDIEKIYPETEDLEITSKFEEQNFNHPDSYGYDNVVVKPVVMTEIDITPTNEVQSYTGIFNKVTVETDDNLIPQNIKKDVNIFGVTGTGEMLNLEINDCGYLFAGGHRLNQQKDILSLCKNINNVEGMFSETQVPVEIDLTDVDLSNITSCSRFGANSSGITNIKLNKFGGENLTDASYFLTNCTNNNFIELDLSNCFFENVTNAYNFIYACLNLTKIILPSFKKIENCNNMIYRISNLVTLDLSKFDFQNTISINNMIYRCQNLENLYFGINLGKGFVQKVQGYNNYTLDLSVSTKLTHESLMSIINNIYDLNLTYDVANGGVLYSQKLILGATNLEKLTEEEKEIATNKGWILS